VRRYWSRQETAIDTKEAGMNELAVVPFHGYELQSWKGENDTVYVGMRHVCKTLGLDWAGQSVKLQKSKLFKDFIHRCDHRNSVGAVQSIIGLDVGMLPMFLAGVNCAKVAPAVRETLLVFQRECADVLKAYWFHQAPLPVAHKAAPVPIVGGGPSRSLLERLELLERVRVFLKEDDQYTEPVSKAFSAMARGLVFQEFQRVA